MTTILVIVLTVAVLAAIAVSITRYRRSRDGVDSFRRQIDALSPEARRPVVDQVQSAAEANDASSADDEEDDDDDGT
ncbi:MAG: hypothetical protein CL424_08100 [Acidimicrobiaceae bacterium]|nr:hypothetical protein [Acidimicrobiaceae bacterium]